MTALATGLVGLSALTGCSAVTSSATSALSAGVTSAMLDQNDPETVRLGAPAYLLMIDGLIANDPDDPDLLAAGADLYSSYTSGFVDDPERAVRLAEKARSYGFAALCESVPATCDSWRLPFEDFAAIVGTVSEKHLSPLFTAASAWATWVQVNRDDWVALADKARVEAMMLRVIALDPGFRMGAAYSYLGVLNSLIPPALGGKPEQGRAAFERAIELSDGRDLMTKVLFAREYARLVFDRELHDRLLTEVVEADPEVSGLVLSNVIAQRIAKRLLVESDEYFAE